MRFSRKIIITFIMTLAVTTTVLGSPGTRYQEYLELMAGNAAMDKVLPFMNKEMREKLSKAPRALKRLQGMAKYQIGAGSVVSGESIDGENATVEMTPVKEQNGRMTYIKIEMIKENDQWVILRPIYSNTPQ